MIATQLIFAVYDSKSENFSKPIYVQKEGQMVRSFMDIANDKNHPIGQHPEDYFLYQIATWNEDSGEYQNLSPHKSLGKALDYVNNTHVPEEKK